MLKKLITILKQSLNKDTSDQEVAHEVLTFLGNHGTHQTNPQAWYDDWYYHESDSWDDSFSKNYSRWPQGYSQTQKNGGNSFDDPNSGTQEEPFQHVNASRHRTARFIDPGQWNGTPVLTNYNAVQEALTKGDDFPGNLIITTNESVVSSLQQCWSAFNCDKPFTVAIATVQPSKGPSISIWWNKGPKHGARPVHQKVVLYQVGNTKGPEPQEAKQVTFPDKIGPKLVTLRLIVPDFYRKAFLANDQKDTPTTAIGSWAKQLNIPASSLTGGNWQELNLKHGKMMIAHIRTTADIAQKATSHSGFQGFFATTLPGPHSPRDKVVWVPRKSDESIEHYFRSACALAAKHKKPMAIRQGGSSDLGLVGADIQIEGISRIKT